jgi:hypothetical protein
MTTTALERKAKCEKSNELEKSQTPEPLYPCRSKLMALLSEFEAVTNGISDFEAKLSRAQLDLDRAIDTDEDENISRYQPRPAFTK